MVTDSDGTVEDVVSSVQSMLRMCNKDQLDKPVTTLEVM
jgi:hypothetical protein